MIAVHVNHNLKVFIRDGEKQVILVEWDRVSVIVRV